MTTESTATPDAEGGPDYDVIVVGAGLGGIYAVSRFVKDGLSVFGVEAGADVGGVWYHNRYPGARVDVESYFYSYFDEDLYREWQWNERYPTQPEILRYLNFAADRLDVRRHFRFSTWMTGAQWHPQTNSYTVTTDTGLSVTARYLVMTSGQLSKPRKPNFAGIDDFEGEWYQTSQWPERGVDFAGQRVGVIGTGSSGVQTISAIAPQAGELVVFQRTANYTIPAVNGALDQQRYRQIAEAVDETWGEMLAHPGGALTPLPTRAAFDYTDTERAEVLEKRWAYGGHAMNAVFTDQGTNMASNDIVSEFVRSKIRQLVDDPETAQILSPVDYPIGSRRLCVCSGYYETFNRENVSLVDIKNDPIVRITPTGVQTESGHVDLDVLVFAIGFDAFTGALDNANVANEHGSHPSDSWKRGPRTYLGLMTTGFPNLFIVTGPGSPSVLINFFAGNVQHIDFVADLISYMTAHEYTRVEPDLRAQDAWTQHVADVSSKLLRLNVENYMVHVNRDDNTRVFMPYAGGLSAYIARCDEIVASGYEGFVFDETIESALTGASLGLQADSVVVGS
ncbi:MAG: cyclohexanone monooxygenase [Subtercola sp.]|nr:cyclohexanone monooxygenase [Subtercola sp.]